MQRAPGSLEVHFVVTDFKHDVPVSYTGVLPDLFREGRASSRTASMLHDGTFVADEVLAKHDEKYMPPGGREVAEAATASRATRRAAGADDRQRRAAESAGILTCCPSSANSR